jgi:hypothetical protein
METHFYCVVTCKTPACKTTSAVKYLGPRSQKLRPLPRNTEFSYECPQCHREHPYAVGELQVRSYGFGPPEDWVSQF